MSKRTAWYRSLQAHVVLIQLCDNELRRDCGIPMVWYDVLVKLWLAPEQSLRMSELADQALLSRSWLTRRVRATMTEKGKQVFLDWEQSHSRSIERHFSRHLSNDEATVIAAAFDRIAQEGRRSLAGSAPTVDTASRSSPDA
jgi:AraC-like DNA-binding protein